MPTITNKTVSLDPILQRVLNTNVDQWNEFFAPQLIKPIFVKLAEAIITADFFVLDYNFSKFLDFLTTYVKTQLTQEKLAVIDVEILAKFDHLLQQIQARVINHFELDARQRDLLTRYLQFLHLLMENEHRCLFFKSKIKFDVGDLHAISSMLQRNAMTIDDVLIEKYTALLKLSFDVPKFLEEYSPISRHIASLAKASFWNPAINSHILITKIFNVLGYQGQLLDYYRNDTRFNISNALLAQATEDLSDQAIRLQTYFFSHLSQRQDINKSLLQHYLYSHFFKVLYAKYLDKLNALADDKSLMPYVKVDYRALPNHLDCVDYFSPDYKVRIEYADLSEQAAKMACQAITCSQASHQAWKASLSLKLPSYRSDYIFRVGSSDKDYENFPYAYGYTPLGGGFYISGQLKNNSVSGTAYSYWGKSSHNFINVARHEAVHHDNYRLYRESLRVNSRISAFTNRNFDEGLAVLFAGGACAPGYIDQDLRNITAPRLETLLQREYIGYGTSWLYNNYLIQQYPHFYVDLLSIDRDDFEDKWTALLNKTQPFADWLTSLKQTCQQAPKELSLENCPSIYLKDYLPAVMTNSAVTRAPLGRTSHFFSSSFTTKSQDVDEMGRALIFKIHENNLAEFQRLLNAGANPNYRDLHTGNTPLHYLFYYRHCNAQWAQLLLAAGAKIVPNTEGALAYRMAEETCSSEQLASIKEVFDEFASHLDTTTSSPGKTSNETKLEVYLPKQKPLIIVLPLSSLHALLSGAVSAFSDEAVNRYKECYPYLPALIRYGVKPLVLSMASASMDSLLLGSARFIGLEEVGSSFLSYFAINYFGLLIAQPIERTLVKKIKNKVLNFLLPVLLYTSLLNPGLLLSEGFMEQLIPLIFMPLVNGLLFQLSKLGTHTWMDKFFPENSTANDAKGTYVAYELDDNLNLFEENPVKFTFKRIDMPVEAPQSFKTFGREQPAPLLPTKQVPKLPLFSSIFSPQPINSLTSPPTQEELAEMGITTPECRYS